MPSSPQTAPVLLNVTLRIKDAPREGMLLFYFSESSYNAGHEDKKQHFDCRISAALIEERNSAARSSPSSTTATATTLDHAASAAASASPNNITVCSYVVEAWYAPGHYEARVTVKSGLKTLGEAKAHVFMRSELRSVSLSASDFVATNVPLTLTADAAPPSNETGEVVFTFAYGDGFSAPTVLKHSAHAYLAPGIYNATLSAENGISQVMASRIVTVRDALGHINITLVSDGSDHHHHHRHHADGTDSDAVGVAAADVKATTAEADSWPEAAAAETKTDTDSNTNTGRSTNTDSDTPTTNSRTRVPPPLPAGRVPAAASTAVPAVVVMGAVAAFECNGPQGTYELTWDFDDGSSPISLASPTVTHTFTAVGTYNVTVEANNQVSRAFARLQVTVQHKHASHRHAEAVALPICLTLLAVVAVVLVVRYRRVVLKRMGVEVADHDFGLAPSPARRGNSGPLLLPGSSTKTAKPRRGSLFGRPKQDYGTVEMFDL